MEKRDRGLGWKYDLPAPNTETTINPRLKTPPHALTHMNENYTEVSRVTLKLRGVWIFAGAAILIMALTGPFNLYSYFQTKLSPAELKELPLYVFFHALFFCFLTPYIRMEFSLPKSEPIRFNRQRRKVYFYQYRFNLLNPFGKKGWGVIPVAYDWDDLTLEAYRIYAPGYGGIKEEVKISICKPGTNEIIDRVFFTDDIEAGEHYWAIVRLFMQQGPDAIPDFLHPTTNKDEIPDSNLGKKAVFRNPFDRLAPEVQWPAEMDRESRTAPAPEEQR
ncbi:magnesium transporter [Pseudomonas sp. LRP2-20]|uniref:DUF6708 domain-containing protein n=1 Tax=Pseudomonas sp. LRP2-20 TaxID=2944234 RepID=UPI00218BD12F|nr:DUF6708 domain-containing protein [Pseudomonas sp. LRP2-20]BDM23401.1 magnesium transporter [Pseudomonas sp. LRP2-20]